MRHGLDQLTLLTARPDLASLVASLGPYYSCLWCALEDSVTRNAPVASDDGPVWSLLRNLQAAGVLLTETSDSPSTRRSLYHPFAWTYSPAWQALPNLRNALAVALNGWQGPAHTEARVALWGRLVNDEISAYLANLLRRHRISPERANGVIAMQESPWFNLSSGRRRYVAWSGMRVAASVMLQTEMNEEAAMQALCKEMQIRSRWLQRREQEARLGPREFSFLPNADWRRPIAIEVALGSLLGSDSDYWTLCPSAIRLTHAASSRR